MLPTLKPNQSVFIEITNPEHGGPGWEFGSCLWSPAKDRGNSRAWKLMDEVEPGNLILHLLKIENHYVWAGASIASSVLQEVEDGPPLPDRWADMSPYQRIELDEFHEIESPLPIANFFSIYEEKLRDLLRTSNERTFYEE
ncbi:hypothetical protein ACFL1B_02840, partial [Nanoarchaeota archaeon]